MRRLDRDEEPGPLHKYRAVIGGGIVVVLGIAVWFSKGLFDQSSRSRPDQRMVMIDLPPPAPPPPPPPTQAPPPPTETEQKMIAQETVDDSETKPDNTPKNEAPANDSPALATSIQGNGPADGFGLRGGNSVIGGTAGKSAGQAKASRWGWYANQVQGAISKALQGNSNTRTADFRVVAQIWSDRTGKITRARLTGSTGNTTLDKAITDEVLVGYILQEPPPEGMPMPIVLRLTARPSQAALTRQY
ncbi:MAG: TonB C-terminal domain-containing protein [Verrucomicrobiota bacterium]